MNMPREHSHFENREPALEKFLRFWRRKKIEKYIPENSSVLDLGCGFDGSLLRKIEKRVESGTGLDISVNKNFSNPKIKLIEHNLNDPLPFPASQFDAAISLASLEHLENPERSLREIHRVLKPGGKLLLTAPSAFGKPVLEILSFLRLVSRQEIKDHKNYFNKKILLDYCRICGFREVRHRYFQLGMNNFLAARK